MNSYLIQPEMMGDLQKDFFTTECSIQQPSYATSGEALSSGYADKLTGLYCRISEWMPKREGNSVMRDDGTVVIHPWHVVVNTYQSTITEKDRLVIGSDNYDILSVHYDSENEMTRLIVEIVK